MASNEERVRELSLQFYREMSSIGSEFNLYFERWSIMDKIDANPDRFKKESQGIAKQLRDRINKEEKMLFFYSKE